MIPERKRNALALCLYAVVQLVYLLARTQRKGWDHLGTTFGKCAMLNFVVLLIPVSRTSPVLNALFMAPEIAVRFHRFLGRAMLCAAVAHCAWFVVIWSMEGVLLQMLLSWQGEKPVLAGSLALLVSAPLFVLSIPRVRRRYSYELFLYTHRFCALLFAVFVVCHYPGILWWCVPSLLLYLSDHATQLKTWPRGGGAPLVKRTRAAAGVISVTLECPSDFTRPKPLQWVRLHAPRISSLQWHPFTVASTTGAELTVAISACPSGWTGALASQIAEGGVVDLRVGGPYGLGYDFDDYDLGRPLFMVAGGSGGTPFTSLVQGISRREGFRTPPVMLVWAFRTEEMMREFVTGTGLHQFALSCPKLTVKLFVTAPKQGPIRPIELGSEGPGSAGQVVESSSSRLTQSQDRTLTAFLCHMMVPIGALHGVQCGLWTTASGGLQFAYLLIGAFVGAVLANSLAVLVRLLGSRYSALKATAPTSPKTSAGKGQTTAAPNEHVANDTLGAAPQAEIANVRDQAAGARSGDESTFSYHSGRPDVDALLTQFEERCAPELKDMAGRGLRHLKVMASGPPSLVRGARSAAHARRHEFEAMSFEL